MKTRGDEWSCRHNKTENEKEVVSIDTTRVCALQWKQRNLVSERKDNERPLSLSSTHCRERGLMIWLAYYKAKEDDEVLFRRCDNISKAQWMQRHHVCNIQMWTESMSHRLNHPTHTYLQMIFSFVWFPIVQYLHNDKYYGIRTLHFIFFVLNVIEKISNSIFPIKCNRKNFIFYSSYLERFTVRFWQSFTLVHCG